MNHQTEEANVSKARPEGFYLVKYNGDITAAKFDGHWYILCGLPMKKREHQLDQVIRILR